MTAPDYSKWTQHQLWTLVDVACLLCGMEPVRPLTAFDRTHETGGIPARIYNDLKDAIDLGHIKCWESRDGFIHGRRVKPDEAIDWASGRGYNVPDALTRLIDVGKCAPAASQDEPAWISRNEVIAKFPKYPDDEMNFSFWDGRLEGRAEWIKPAIGQRGKRGVSTLWRPLLLAHCLLDKGEMTIGQLDRVISKHWPDWVDQWREETQDKR